MWRARSAKDSSSLIQRTVSCFHHGNWGNNDGQNPHETIAQKDVVARRTGALSVRLALVSGLAGWNLGMFLPKAMTGVRPWRRDPA